MYIFWYFIKCKPSNFIKLMWFTNLDFFSVNTNFEIKCYPVCRFSIMDTMNVPITEKLIIQNICTILLLNFLTDCLVNGFAKLQSATADVPSSVLVPSVVVAFCHNKLAFSIMTKINYANSSIINAFYHIV